MTTYDKHDIRNLDDDQYPRVPFGPNPEARLEPTDEQCMAVFRKWKQDTGEKTWAEFAASVHPTFGCNDAVTVQWAGMWLCIEKDGYTHS